MIKIQTQSGRVLGKVDSLATARRFAQLQADATRQPIVIVPAARKPNGRKRNPQRLKTYKGHVLEVINGRPTVIAYGKSFNTYTAAKRWLDRHVAAERG